MKTLLTVIWFALVCVLIWLGGSCEGGQPPVIQGASQVSDTDLESQVITLMYTIKDMHKDIQELKTQVADLQNKRFAAASKPTPTGNTNAPTWSEASNPPKKTTARTLVRTVRAERNGKISETGPIVWRQYSDGSKEYKVSPVVRRAAPARVVSSRPISFGSSYMMPSSSGWSSSFYGGGFGGSFGCAGGS